ncbi:hypothetical protein V1517DRAFT_339473 [Lipomyces orientalis]|uniref:Uncharacterized protein n=1 Tax=Lipomyces orientalis TaxID=1233043 RepID=A0ACC3TKT1_9ASCO
MVGVAGGSRGCANCRKRKIKCDETVPKCLRCIKSNRDCGGPIARFVFIKERVGTEKCRSTIRSVASKRSLSSGCDPEVSPRRSLRQMDEEKTVNAIGKEITPRPLPSVLFERSIQRQLWAFDANSIPRELELFPGYDLYDHCVKSFLDRCSIVGYLNRFGEFHSMSTWTETLPQFVLSPIASSTTFASRALVISHCSSMVQDPDVGLLASNWYVHALRYQKELVSLIISNLQKASPTTCLSRSGDYNIVLVDEGSASRSESIATSSSYQSLIEWACSNNQSTSNPSKNTVLLPENSSTPLNMPILPTDRNLNSMRGNMISYMDDSVTAGMLLATCEVINGSSDSWASLVSGATELMRLRGPDAYQNGFNSTLFQSLRGMIAVYSFVVRKKSFLNDLEWKSIPWKYGPSRKLIHHRLLDLMLELPEYLEIVERALVYSFTNEDDPDDPRPTQRVPRLRKKCRNRQAWAELRETHKKLTDLETRLADWFEVYSEGARKYAREKYHFPSSVTFVPATATANIPLPRCPATTSDSEYISTHFFRPIANYATVDDARMTMWYYATRMMISYLHQLTIAFAYLDLEEALASNPSKGHPEISAYIGNKMSSLHDWARVVCGSLNFVMVHTPNVAVLNFLFPLIPLRIAHAFSQDTLERGWIWNELRRMHDMGFRVSLPEVNYAQDEQHVTDWKKFKRLEVCPGCGEHVRPKIQCYDMEEENNV